MKITKKFRIREVRSTTSINAPFQIVLEGGEESDQFRFRGERGSSLTLDTDTCTRYNIPLSLELVGRMLIGSFESRELPLNNSRLFEGCVDRKSIDSDTLAIHSLKRSEVVSPSFGTLPPSKFSEVSQTLELLSFDAGDGMHPNPLPCPFYRIVLGLSAEEYEACKALPPTSVIKASFRLA